MASGNDIILSVNTALLSATSVEGEIAKGAASLVPVSGEPLIAYQVGQLVKAGISSFLIEVDVVSGALVALSDRLAQKNIALKFIRSPQELEGILGIGDLLLVMSDGIVADDALLAEMIAKPSPYIVTLDGRKENANFERIDLNSFWGGLALLDHRSVAAIAALPEGWSVGSSLLRQALQDKVTHRPLNQQLLAGKQLRRISTQKEADGLTKELLSRRAHNADGVIEAELFGPMAAKLAPIFWSAPTAKLMLSGAMVIFAGGTVGLAFMGFLTVAVGLALVVIFLLKLNDLLESNSAKNAPLEFANGAAWLFLAGGILLASWLDKSEGIAGLFAPTIALGLLVYAKQGLALSWQKRLLASPAMLCVALLIPAIFDEWTFGIALVVMAQMALLLMTQFPPFRAKQA